MNICLVNPPYSLEERYGKATKNKINYILPPLGLIYLASSLEKRNFNVSILDAQAFDDFNDLFLDNYISNNKFNIIGVTALTPTIINALRLIKYIKKNHPGIITILGGAHASGFYAELLQNNPEIDYICIGESEETLPELLTTLKNKKTLNKVKGIAYKKDGEITITDKREPISDLDALPFPARHLLDNPKYMPLPNNYKKLPVMHMITSRGCNYGQCTFCFEAGRLGHKLRRRSPENVIKEIKELISTYKIKEISFWDDNFLNDQKWVIQFCELLEKEQINIFWSCSARVTNINSTLLPIIKKAGCWTIFIGIESGNQNLLKLIKKGITLEQAEKAVKLCKKFKIETRASYMFALPTETPEMAKKTINFAIKLDTDYAQFCITSPYQGTEMYDLVKDGSYGKISADLEKYNSQTTVFIPNGYSSAEEIEKIKTLAYKKYYLRPKFIFRQLIKIKTFNDLLRLLSGLTFFKILSGKNK